MEKLTLDIKGMTCDHCKAAVTGALEELNGVASVEVKLDKGTADVTYDEAKVSVDQMKETVEDQGYDVN
ncbi:copper chaperone CopZ [Virgibacillus oceani]|uniref:Copper chaperone CopZ n=1 Tax=Virgibacillus oceani TaxID=1479511 RepID=A0A917LW10_9BACI|nr:copper chaperone CopZ [Virgibacillus oceani]GGG60835.1 copper chaperone CopZ [Virgibacillus oceani]